MSLSPETSVPTLLERVARSVADLDGDTATCVAVVPVKEPSRGVAARPRARYTRLGLVTKRSVLRTYYNTLNVKR